MRGLMIWLGSTLISKYGWVTYIFGGFLILTAVKMAFAGGEGVHPDKNILVRMVRKIMPITSHYDGQKFFTKAAGSDGVMKRAATPLFLALLVVEFTDLVFAVDSVPAIFAITTDPFIVYTSNIFAILGLRALYFALAAMVDRFHYLKYALAILLVFIGSKIFVADALGLAKIPPAASLSITFAILATGIVWSLWKTGKGATAPEGA